MKREEVIKAFESAGALLEDHFIYASGRHGKHFLQAARVLQYPEITELLCGALADGFRDKHIELVVGPATGGIILAYATARHLNCRAAFTEKDDDGGMSMRRGFRLQPGTRVLVVEDIITTGGSVQNTLAHLQERGADVAGVGVLIDRSGGKADFPVPYTALAELNLESWKPEDCPLCAQGVPLLEPDNIVV